MKQHIRPLTKAGYLLMVTALPISLSIVEMFLPGKGMAAANVITTFFTELPPSFYVMITAGVLGYQAARTRDKDKKVDLEIARVENSSVDWGDDEFTGAAKPV